MARSLIAGARVMGLDGPGSVEVRGDTIAAVEPGTPAGADVTGAWVVPGFVDLHVHGGGGVSFQQGEAAQVAAFRSTRSRPRSRRCATAARSPASTSRARAWPRRAAARTTRR